jgi:hypothetical protein
MSKKINSQQMRVRVYDVLDRAVEEGVAYGWRRAHKHSEKPDEDHAMEALRQAVMSSICEVFEFPE